MLSQWELWAVASATIDRHGSAAPLFVASRIETLSAAGDAAGVAAWTAIGHRVEQLAADPPASLNA